MAEVRANTIRWQILGDILTERERQLEQEGWDDAHDSQHDNEELARAAACYAWPGSRVATGSDAARAAAWPWDECWDKRNKHSRRRQLVIAAALIMAELERVAHVREKPNE